LDVTHHALQLTDEELVEGFPGLVTVADILKSLGAVLASDVEHDLLTTTAGLRMLAYRRCRAGCLSQSNVRVLVEELGAVVDLLVDYEVHVVLGVVLSNILHGELLNLGHFCGVEVDLTCRERGLIGLSRSSR
jgi:hypothetical protein